MRVTGPLIALKALALAVLLWLGGALGAAPAFAGLNECSVSSSGITFPAYNTVTRAAVDSVGTITVTCNGSGVEDLSLNLTGGNTGSCSPRQMRNGGSSLAYQIFQQSSHVTSFCDGSSRYDIVMDFSTGPNQTRTFTMYGRVTANQTPPWGSYTDTLTLTLKKGGGTRATGTVSINGSVSPACSVSAGTLSFGAYSPGSPALGSAPVSVNCSNGAPYQVSLGSGQNANGVTRRMAGGTGGYLNYFLYSNSGRTVAWGDGTALGSRVNGTGSGNNQTLTVYGRIPGAQAVPPGSYSDSVVVTVEY